MPHNLQITDGTTTISLTTTNVMLSHYVPQEGRKIPGTEAEYGDVTEPIEALVYGASTTTVQQVYGQIQALLFAAACRSEKGSGRRVYLQYQPINDPYLWRSELRGGSVNLGANAMTAWGQAKVPITLVVTRAGFWERAIEVEVAMNSFNSPGVGTGGKIVDNHSDGSTAGNYVTIAAGTITGVLPAPARIEMTNISGGSRIYENIYIANEVLSTTTYFAGMVQGEAAVSGGTVESRPGTSGGNVLAMNLSGIALPRWNFSANQVREAAGRTFRLLVRYWFYTFVSGNIIYVAPRLTEQSGAANLNPYGVEHALPTSTIQTELLDIGTISFRDHTTAAGMALVLAHRTTAPVQVEIDYIQPMPANNFRHLVYYGTGVANNQRIVDDPVEGLAYAFDGSGQQIPVVSPKAQPIMLYPNSGQAQRIYFLHDQGAQAPISHSLSVRIWYRPRRLTI